MTGNVMTAFCNAHTFFLVKIKMFLPFLFSFNESKSKRGNSRRKAVRLMHQAKHKAGSGPTVNVLHYLFLFSTKMRSF